MAKHFILWVGNENEVEHFLRIINRIRKITEK